MVPLGFNGQLVEFVDQSHQQHLVLAWGRDGSEHVILVFPPVCPQARDIPLKSDQEVQLVGAPKPVPRMITFALLTTSFKRKRQGGSVFEIKRQVCVGQTLQRMEMVDHEPNVLELVQFDRDIFHPILVTILRGSPGKISDHVKGDVISIHGGGG